MKPRLLVLTSTFPRWQQDTDPPFVFELSRRLINSFEVMVHTPHFPEAKTREIMAGMDIHRFRYFFSSLEKLAGSTGILPTLRKNKLYYGVVPFFLAAQFCSLFILTKKYRPDIIHAHWLIPQGFQAVIVGMLTKTPVMVTAHGADMFGLQGKLFNGIKRFVLNRAHIITVVSEPIAAAISSLIGVTDKVSKIPMGVDSTLFRSGKRRKKRLVPAKNCLLYVGRLTEKKGICYLIDALSLVLKKYPTMGLLVIGSGELEGSLKIQVAENNLENAVRFLGSVPNNELPGYYADSEIFIGPSVVAQGGDREGFGLTFVEASMSGCLVIGTNTGGIGDIIEDGKTGYLVPQKKSAALARKIIYALEHWDEVNTIRESGKKRCIEKFDWKNISARYSRLLQHIVHD